MNEIENVMKKIEQIKNLEDAEIRHKELKRQIRNLEVWVIFTFLLVICLIVLPFFKLLPFNFITIIMSSFGVLLIMKTFKDGEILELEKFFIELIFFTKGDKDTSK